MSVPDADEHAPAPLYSVQYLRALAATVVVYEHVFSNRIAAPLSGWAFGLWGVDVFFVISGIVITAATKPSETLARFAWKRFARVVPMWWIALTAWILIRIIVPDRLAGADVTPADTILSYLLIPHWHAVFSGWAWPILVPGWTLQFELFFYGCFAASLLAGRPRVRAACLATGLLMLVILGAVFRPASPIGLTYTSPLLLEFLAGVALGRNLGVVLNAPAAVGVALLLGGGLGLFASPEMNAPDTVRVLRLGVPAFMVVAGALCLERRVRRRPSRALTFLGNASYSLYLSHPLAISASAVIWAKLGLDRLLPPASFIPVALVAALSVGCLSHSFVERPLLRLLRGRTRPAAMPAARDVKEAARTPSSSAAPSLPSRGSR